MKRSVLLATSVAFTLLMVTAPLALADVRDDHGEGWIGESNDVQVTYAGFILIAFFPLFALLASIAYHITDKRREQRVKAELARERRADTRGGW